jgi:hypothetical protein
MSLGAEEMDEFEDHALGDYLMFSEGQYVLLRGKYKGKPLNQVPRGYVREYILNAWKDALSEEEHQIFAQYGKKPDEKTGSRTNGDQ